MKPGRQLRRLLTYFDFRYSNTCLCYRIQQRMDEIGPEGCRIDENLENLVFRIGREANRRGVLFSRAVCRHAILKACQLAEKFPESENLSMSFETPEGYVEEVKQEIINLWENRPETPEDILPPSPVSSYRSGSGNSQE